jgi:hypothetical protein
MCYICGSERYKVICELLSDGYQNTIGNRNKRTWLQCGRCGLYYQENGLTDEDLDSIYLNYRGLGLRDETVDEKFKRINAIPYSENNDRINNLIKDGVLSPCKALDIGSGIGIFPYGIKPYVKDVRCIEPNEESAKFIESLGIECHQGNYEPGLFSRSDFVSIIHVLEHIRDPIKFLSKVRLSDMKNDGVLYIEVPDATEFNYLDYTHDEFNSCHLYMFDMSTLNTILRRGGFEPYLIRSLKYPERHLSRITALCRPYHL